MTFSDKLQIFFKEWSSSALIVTISELIEQRFIFASLEYLVMVHPDTYMPREVALIEFSLKSGIIQTHHEFIDPGTFINNYKSNMIHARIHMRHILRELSVCFANLLFLFYLMFLIVIVHKYTVLFNFFKQKKISLYVNFSELS